MSKQVSKADHPDTSMASGHLSERREARYAISFAIEVSGLGRDGEPFHLKTSTLNVSEWGCGFLSPRELRPDDMILVRRVSPEPQPANHIPPEAYFQVVRAERKGAGWLIGAWKMDGQDVWGEELVKLAKADDGRREARKRSGTEQPDNSPVQKNS